MLWIRLGILLVVCVENQSAPGDIYGSLEVRRGLRDGSARVTVTEGEGLCSAHFVLIVIPE